MTFRKIGNHHGRPAAGARDRNAIGYDLINEPKGDNPAPSTMAPSIWPCRFVICSWITLVQSFEAGLIMTTAIQTLATLLTIDHIVLDADISSRQDAFALVDDLLSNQTGHARHEWRQNLIAREQLGSTALGQGVALPHARIRGLDRAVAVYLRPAKPIPFDAPDKKPVAHIVAIFVPEHATQVHLQLLAGVAELFGDPGFRAAIERSGTAADVVRLIGGWSTNP